MSLQFHYDLLKLHTDSLLLSFFKVPWDSELLSRPVAQIENIEVREIKNAKQDFGEFLRWKVNNGIQFSSGRIAENNLLESQLLQENGYRYSELNYQPELTLADRKFGKEAEFEFLTALESDRAELVNMAANIFHHSRFHDDPYLGPQLGNFRYARWMDNAFVAAHQEVVKCVRDERIIAFFVEEHRSESQVFWSLVGLAPGLEGQGLGGRVWRSYLSKLSDSGIKRVSTSISSRNTAIFNLYVSLGFRFPAPSVTYHWHAIGNSASS